MAEGADEIAELEARLAELRRSEAAKAEAAKADGAGGDVETPGNAVVVPEGFDMSTLSSRKKVTVHGVHGDGRLG